MRHYNRKRFVVVFTSLVCVPLGLFSLVAGTVGIPGVITGNRPELMGAGLVLFLTPLTIAATMTCCNEQSLPVSVPNVVTHNVQATSSTEGGVEMVSIVHPQFVLEDNANPTSPDPTLPTPLY